MKPIWFAVIAVALLVIATWAAAVALDRYEISGASKPTIGVEDVAAVLMFAAALACMAKFGGLL